MAGLTERINVQANVAAAMEKECEALRSAVNAGMAVSLFVEACWYHCCILTQQDVFRTSDRISECVPMQNSG